MKRTRSSKAASARTAARHGSERSPSPASGAAAAGHTASGNHRRTTANATDTFCDSHPLASSSSLQGRGQRHVTPSPQLPVPRHGSTARDDTGGVSVSASSASAPGPDMCSQTTSKRASGHARASTEHRSARGSTALVESVHLSRGSAGGFSNRHSPHSDAETEVEDDDDDYDDDRPREGSGDADEFGSGPLRIDKEFTDEICLKRRRPPGSVGVKFAPKQKRRVGDGSSPVDSGHGGSSDADGEQGRLPPAGAESQNPTPRPRRHHTVLNATPAFIREERNRRGVVGPPASAERTPALSPPPPPSHVATGFSRLRESFSAAMMRTPVQGGGQRPGMSSLPPRPPAAAQFGGGRGTSQRHGSSAAPDASPWGLSAIQPGSPWRAEGSVGSRRAGSDFVHNLFPEAPSLARRSLSSSSRSSHHRQEEPQRDDRLGFLRSSRGSGGGSGAGTHSRSSTGGVTDDKENAYPPPAMPTGAGARLAAPSRLGGSLLDIISSASSSRARNSHGTRQATARQEQQQAREVSTASTLMEPDVSPIMKLSEAERRRRSYRDDDNNHIDRPAVTRQAAAPAARSFVIDAVGGSVLGDPRVGNAHQIALPSRRPPPPAPPPDLQPPHRGYTGQYRAGAAAGYDYVAAVTEEEMVQERPATSTRQRAAAGARDSRQSEWLPRLTRRLCAAALAAFFALCLLSATVPLLSTTASPLLPPAWLFQHRGSAEEALAVFYVNSVAELHALYQVPAASLTRRDAERLYHRVLGEGVERLEAATRPLSPLDEGTTTTIGGRPTTHTRRTLFLRQMLVAYEAARRNALLYARSRDRSARRRWAAYPLEDLWRYAVAGRGGGDRGGSVPSLLGRPSLAGALDRLSSAVACLGGPLGDLSDLSMTPRCPSLRYREDAMLAAAQGFLYTDVNAQFDLSEKRWRTEVLAARLQRDWDSEVYLETLLRFVRRDAQVGLRSYNDM